ncbi:MAG: hypothetical protein H6672_19260 [Anaerolineaceae bacterium]|nr:hypothetical protein [Anaerolineaceae bacterium]
MKKQNASQKIPWRQSSGQALVEYALILILVVIALAAALIATGPALGNVFSNTVYNLLGQNMTPSDLSAANPTNFWGTVTAIATNPPQETAFPTNPPPPPTIPPTPGPSLTPTDITPTATPTDTPWDTITPTATDAEFTAPLIDPIDHPDWWRTDTSVYLGGEDWKGEYYPNNSLSGTPYEYSGRNYVWNYELPFLWGGLHSNHKGQINFDWGTDGPIPGFDGNNFSIRFTRTIHVASDMTVNFSVRADDYYGLQVDSNTIWGTWTSGDRSTNYTLTAGTHELVFEFRENSGNAFAFLDINVPRSSTPDDANLGGGVPQCAWGRIAGIKPNTLAWAWFDNIANTNGIDPNMLCHLELRGFVDISTLANPQMSFFDVWDLQAGAQADLQIAQYQPYSADFTSGGPDWTTGLTIPLHNSGSNYNWTRNVVDLSALGYTQVAYRFRIRSTAGTGIRRWYVDDVNITERNTRTFTVCHNDKLTCGSYWNLDSQNQASDFITSGRFALSTQRAWAGDANAMAWNDSPFANYDGFGSEQGSDVRIHYVEFNGQIDLTDISPDGSGGQPDWEGDDGMPLLTFYSEYDLDYGDVIEIQWTRDARDTTPDNWTRAGAVLATGRSSDGFSPIEFRLDTIPNWYSQPFRLRFALVVDRNSNSRAGWYIDEIAIQREGLPRYSDYPFCDDAERGVDNWFLTGSWGVIGSGSGIYGSAHAFTDSPLGNYLHGSNNGLELRYPIDFNNDSPENLTVWGGNKDCNNNPSGPAAHPMLSFWHWRNLNPYEDIYVDIYRAENTDTGTVAIPWTPVWSYSYNSVTRDQFAWERIEVDMQAAIEAVTGVSWSTLTSNGDTHDDDFFFRIRLDARSNTAVDDGIYVDNIDVYEYKETVHKLWSQMDDPGGLGLGGGDYKDNIDQPSAWWLRWRYGGDWNVIDWDQHSILKSFHDSPPENTNYRDKTFSVLEMDTIIDLRGTQASDNPIMYFWTHFNIGQSDYALVQFAPENSAQTTQQYERLYGWDAWQTVWSKEQWSRRDTWGREQIDLIPFIGTRIRVRFVLYAYTSSGYLRDGFWVDDVQFVLNNPTIYGLPFFDNAQNTANWVTEGRWGLAPDMWKGTGGGPASLGPNPWYGYFIDCPASCSPSRANTTLDSVPRPQDYPDTGSYVAAMEAYEAAHAGEVLEDYTLDVDHDFGSTGRPTGGEFDNTWADHYVGRWVRDISIQSGDYTFIVRSDDGVRLRYETNPAGGEPPGWNLVEQWKYQGATVYMSNVTLTAGDYRLILEWFEATGSAVIQLSAGNNTFSFSDSPRLTLTSPVVQSVRYGDSSLILDGLLNLYNPAPGTPGFVWAPQLQFYTYYDLDSGNRAYVEVTDTGGFSWTRTGLNTGCTPACDDPIIYGYSQWLPPSRDWRLRRHNLESYADNFIGLRFRLYTDSAVNDGWWITEIQVNN